MRDLSVSKHLKGGVIFSMPSPPHPLPPPPLLPPQHKAIRDVGLRQNLTPLPFYHLTPISLESLQERELIPKCTKKCVENIYI